MSLVELDIVRKCLMCVASQSAQASGDHPVGAIHLWMGFRILRGSNRIGASLIGAYSTADWLLRGFHSCLCRESGRDCILVICLGQPDDFAVELGDSS